MKNIVESEMKFGEFEEEDLFEIEKSKLRMALGEGIKSVEFVLLKAKKNIIFLEAKKTCPNEKNMHYTPEKERKFEEYYSSITKKFEESLQVYLAAVLNRYSDQTEIGDHLRNLRDFSKKEIRFVLVIKEAKIDWLAGPKAILENRLLSLRKIWGIEILVLNHELARKYGLISDT